MYLSRIFKLLSFYNLLFALAEAVFIISKYRSSNSDVLLSRRNHVNLYINSRAIKIINYRFKFTPFLLMVFRGCWYFEDVDFRFLICRCIANSFLERIIFNNDYLEYLDCIELGFRPRRLKEIAVFDLEDLRRYWSSDFKVTVAGYNLRFELTHVREHPDKPYAFVGGLFVNHFKNRLPGPLINIADEFVLQSRDGIEFMELYSVPFFERCFEQSFSLYDAYIGKHYVINRLREICVYELIGSQMIQFFGISDSPLVPSTGFTTLKGYDFVLLDFGSKCFPNVGYERVVRSVLGGQSITRVRRRKCGEYDFYAIGLAEGSDKGCY